MNTTEDGFSFDQDDEPTPPKRREAQIAGEIAARLIEWSKIASRKQVALWLEALRTGAPFERITHANPDAQRIKNEIVERFNEWAGDHEAGGIDHVRRWLSIGGAIWGAGPGGPDAFWLYVAFQTGDASQIAASFEERGKDKALPRQALHQSFTQALAMLRLRSPVLADALRELYERHSPEAAAAGGMVHTGAQVVKMI